MAKDPYRYFRIEANELLDQLSKGVLDFEKGPQNAELIQRLLRLAHTLKGAARVVKLAEIADHSHQLEDILLPYRDAQQVPSSDSVDLALKTIDGMMQKLQQLPLPESDLTTQQAPELQAPIQLALQAPVRMMRSDLVEVDSLLEGLSEIGNELGGVRRAIQTLERVQNLTAQISMHRTMAPGKIKSTAEEIHTLLTATERAMSAGVLRIDRELNEAREAAERLRLVPIASIFNALERTARDAAHITGKQAEFRAIGGDIRIEGAVLDTVQSALIQLVRNAVAHGIEPYNQRCLKAKAATGQITLTVERRGYRAYFRCVDDGAGIDLDAVKRAAVKKGMAPADAEKLNADELMTLLLKGGISTTNVPTEISGRGIGLNLVREAMQQLGGEVTARSEAGRGTTIELSAPLSIAALDVLIVENFGAVAAIPLDAVRCTVRITRDDIIHTPHGHIIVYENKQIPFSPLMLGVAQKTSPKRSELVSKSNAMANAMTVVILKSTNAISAIAVERLRGMDTVILRALPASCPTDPIVLGVHVDGEGDPRMVLDPDVLITKRWSGDEIDEPTKIKSIVESLPILIIDDSLTTRMLESSILESAGFKVELATCAEDGLEMARRRQYALFLVDVEMPGMSGFECVQHVKADSVLKDTPCILVTSLNSEEDRQRGIECGASAFIVKGEFDQVEFLDRVAELITATKSVRPIELVEQPELESL